MGVVSFFGWGEAIGVLIADVRARPGERENIALNQDMRAIPGSL
jgi:hypothetical protein